MQFNLTINKHGFGFNYNGSESRWSISIESMVPRHKRYMLSDFYILVREKGKLVDRYYIDGGNIVSVRNYDIPHYVQDTVVDILNGKDINNFLDNEEVSNRFTEFAAKKRGLQSPSA